MEWKLRKKRQKESEGRMAALCGGHIASHRGPGSKGSSFSRLPTKHPWRKSCAPHNNTTAPGHPHTGNLRSLPPFQGIQTHSCCQPRAPTAYWRGSEGALTRIQQTEEKIWIMTKTHFHKYSSVLLRFCWDESRNGFDFPFFGLTCKTDVMFF